MFISYHSEGDLLSIDSMPDIKQYPGQLNVTHSLMKYEQSSLVATLTSWVLLILKDDHRKSRDVNLTSLWMND